MLIERPGDEARTYRVYRASMESIDMPPDSVDHTITDPPYLKRTQDNGRKATRSGPGKMSPEFEPLTDLARDVWAARIAQVTRNFALVFSDHEGSMLWAADLERYGMEYVRCGLWIRTGDEGFDGQRPANSGAPQLTGDYPAAGHEVIVICRARGRGRIRWQGGGHTAIYTAPVVRGVERFHETQKPIELLRDLVRDFTVPGQVIWDPFAGSGTTLVAAKQLGRYALGADSSEKYAGYAQRRVMAASPT